MFAQNRWKAAAALLVASVVLATVGWQQLIPQPTQRATVTLTAALTTTSGTQTIGPQDLIIIDTHAHLFWEDRSGGSPDLALRTAVEIMDRLGVKKTLIAPPPFPPGIPGMYDYKALIEASKKYSERFAVLAGGGSLNPMIHSIRPQEITSDIRRNFEETAREILGNGAVGFSELAAEHFSLHFDHHPYLSTAPDHPLLLLLADIAASRDVPIDLHMEAIPQDMPLPEKLSGPPNPKALRENIAAFERLLSHNRDAQIIWAHAGWDNTGYRTVPLMRQLLQRHSNLYMSVRCARSLHPENMPLNERGEIRAEWLDLVRSFPDRFVIGSDTFFGVTGEVTWRTLTGEPQPKEDGTWVFLRKLPPDLAKKIAYENVLRIYKLKSL